MNSATYGQTRFHFSSGLDGPVRINVPSSAFHDEYWPDDETSRPVELAPGIYQVEVPGEDIMALVLDTFRSELVRQIEDADDEAMKELLRLAVKTQLQVAGAELRGFLYDIGLVLSGLPIVGDKAVEARNQLATTITHLTNTKHEEARASFDKAARAAASA